MTMYNCKWVARGEPSGEEASKLIGIDLASMGIELEEAILSEMEAYFGMSYDRIDFPVYMMQHADTGQYVIVYSRDAGQKWIERRCSDAIGGVNRMKKMVAVAVGAGLLGIGGLIVGVKVAERRNPRGWSMGMPLAVGGVGALVGGYATYRLMERKKAVSVTTGLGLIVPTRLPRNVGRISMPRCGACGG